MKLARDIERSSSTEAHYIADVNAIVAFLSSHVRDGEIVVVMSNGGFDGLIDKLIGDPGRRR